MIMVKIYWEDFKNEFKILIIQKMTEMIMMNGKMTFFGEDAKTDNVLTNLIN